MNMQQFARTSLTSYGRGGVILRPRNADGISLDEIQARTPAVFADDKHESRSSRYTFISTRHMLEGMTREGFKVVEVRQGGSRDVDKRGFTKHLIRFRHASQVGAAGRYYQTGESQFGANAKRGDSFHEVGVLNSHDGTSKYKAFSAWFRIACLNGLYSFDSSREHQSIDIAHKGDVLGQVIDAAYTVIKNGAEEARQIEHLQGIQLDRSEQLAFAKAAAELRWEDGNAPVEPRLIVTPRRPEDNQRDLWTTFNVAQENLIRGDLPFDRQQLLRDRDGNAVGHRTVHTATRPVLSIDGDVKLNRALWRLADEMAKLKG